MSRPAPAFAIRALLTWSLVCLAPEMGLAGVLAAVEPVMATDQADPQAVPPAPVPPDVAPPAQEITEAQPTTDSVVVVRHDRGSRIRIGGPLVVERGERVEDVVAVLGDVTVRGEVTGDAVAVGGSIHVEDGGSVGGQVVAVGGRIITAPTARLSGRAEQVAIDFPEVVRIGPDGPDVVFRIMPDWQRVIGASVGVSVFRLVSLLLLGLAVAVVLAGRVGATADQAAGSPFESLVIGLGLQIVLIPVVILTSLALLVSLIGLPLVPVLLLVAGGLWLVGFVGATAALGRGALRLAGVASPSLPAAFLVGGLPFAALTIGSRLAWWSYGSMGGPTMAAALTGLAIEGLLWSIGGGAFVLSLLRGASPAPTGTMVPPSPPVPVQSA